MRFPHTRIPGERSFTTLWFLITLAVGLLQTANASDVILEEGFEQVDSAGWRADWQATPTRSVQLRRESGDSYISIENRDPRAMVRIKRTIPLPDAGDRISITARVRVQGLETGEAAWHDARILARFVDTSGRVVSEIDPVFFKSDVDWQQTKVTATPPEEADRVVLVAALFRATGRFDIDEVTLKTLSADERDSSNLLPGGEISSWGGSVPAGWTMAQRDQIEVLSEAEKPRIRLKNSDIDSVVRLSTEVPLTEVDDRLSLEADLRTQRFEPGKGSWHDARIIWSFVDDEGQTIGSTPEPLYLNQTHDWLSIRHSAVVPPGTAYVKVAIGMFNSTGTFEVSNLRLASDAIDRSDERDAELSGDERLWWGEEPVESEGAYRGRIVLNGLWKWMPASRSADDTVDGGWGYIRVPGAWYAQGWNAYRIDDIVARGSGGRWVGLDPSRIDRAWYEREITIPEAWADREVVLDLTRLSTDAAVFLDHERVGEINWPFGVLDLTEYVDPGETHRLRLLVAATTTEGKVRNFLDANSVHVTEASLPARGLVGDVILKSRPGGSRLDDVFVQTSVREKKLTIDATLVDIFREGRFELEAVVRGPDGAEIRRFSKRLQVREAPRQTVTLSHNWREPRLWEVGDPYLYTVEVSVKGDGLRDAMTERFGFREFWIEGRQFFLNGKPINLRPIHHDAINEVAGVREAVSHHIEGYLDAGFNAMELWPKNTLERGSVHFWQQWARIADEKGFLLIYPALSVNSIVNINRYDEAELDEYERRMAKRLRKTRNHPSIVMWTTTANRFAHADDQNPRRIGQTENLRKVTPADQWHLERQEVGEAVLDRIRKHDPTRPVTSHHAGGLGDVHTMNHYLCLLPLQEREEWLSQWSQRGDKPYLAVELGTPWFATFLRGRTANVPARRSERLFTEYAAWYLGPKAYELEPDFYRRNVADSLVSAQDYQLLSGSRHDRFFLPHFFELQELYTRNTWRSWRAWGHSGGSIPWSTGFGWVIRGSDTPMMEMPPFTPGRLGPYKSEMRSGYVYGMKDGGYRQTPVGKVFEEVNGPTLAWIAGPADEKDPGSFTAKDHHFFGGKRVEKQIILHNDTRSPQPFTARWSATLGGRRLAGESERGTIDVGEQRRIVLRFETPEVKSKTRGEITLNATVGENTHEDEFAYRLFPETPPWQSGAVMVFDPVGDTTDWLHSLGVPTRDWTGETGTQGVLVVGRDALQNPEGLPGSIASFVEAGGRAVVFGQQPEWWRDRVNARVAAYVGRRYWPVASQEDHPILTGLDAEDFRDWNGSGTLIPETANVNFDKRVAGTNYPRHGWHWGNRGSVSSAAIEKPHHSRMTPLLEGQFDLAFSPLMEMQHGKGHLIVTTLDLEGRENDPVASHVTLRMLKHARDVTIPNSVTSTVLVGNDGGLLQRMGVQHTVAVALPNPPSIAVIGSDHGLNDAAIKRYLRRGGRVLALPKSGVADTLGYATSLDPQFDGELDPPDWPEAAGLSASDIRLRSPMPLDVLARGPGEVSDRGLLARNTFGDGTAILLSLTPDMLDSEVKTYYRYTSWRLTRSIAQILGNMGAAFDADHALIALGDPTRKPEPLARNWQILLDRDNDLASRVDPLQLSAGRTLAEAKPDALQIDGAVWYRKTIDVPASMRSKPLRLSLGPVDDFDTTYVNGRRVGSTGQETKQWWEVPRNYDVPAKLVGDQVVIAVRVFDRFGNGGLTGDPAQLQLIDPDSGEAINLAGAWKLRVEQAIHPAETTGGSHEDAANRGEAEGWHRTGLDDAGWLTVSAPGTFETPLERWSGPVTLLKNIDIPAAWEGQPLRISLADVPGLEGVRFKGRSLQFNENSRGWVGVEVPGTWIAPGEASLELRFAAGKPSERGLRGPEEYIYVGLVEGASQAPLYIRGYREDFKFGDDPFRYYRW